MPEPNRTLVAYRFMRLVGQALLDSKNEEALTYWQQRGALEFKRSCELTANLPRVAETLQVDATKLADFCNKWYAMEMFRPANDDEAEWKPITAEMNNLRQTIIGELVELANSEKPNG